MYARILAMRRQLASKPLSIVVLLFALLGMQDAVFIGSKRLLGKKSKKAARYWRNVGLGFTTPKEAKEGNFVDKKCPFTGSWACQKQYS
jgi:hypothetical protein